MRKLAGALVMGLGFGVPAVATAQDRERAEQVQAVISCRAQSDTAARLRCFDQAAAALEQGLATGQVIALDRERARRGRFGLSVPGYLDNDSDQPATLTAKISSSAHSGFNRWQIVLDNDQVWRTTETSEGEPPPRPGTSVTITSGLLGGYVLVLPGKRRYRIARVR